jgi:hypothetical protein
MRVRAVNLGYYNDARIRPGTVFEMPEEDMKVVEGNPVLPRWVELATAKPRVEKSAELNLPGVKVKHNRQGQQKPGFFGKGKHKEEEPEDEQSSSGDADVI